MINIDKTFLNKVFGGSQSYCDTLFETVDHFVGVNMCCRTSTNSSEPCTEHDSDKFILASPAVFRNNSATIENDFVNGAVVEMFNRCTNVTFPHYASLMLKGGNLTAFPKSVKLMTNCSRS